MSEDQGTEQTKHTPTETGVDEGVQEPVTITGISGDEFVADRMRARQEALERLNKQQGTEDDSSSEEDNSEPEGVSDDREQGEESTLPLDEKTLDALAEKIAQRQRKQEPEAELMEDNPLRSVTDQSELEKRAQNAETVIKWAQRELRKNNRAEWEEEIVTVDNRPMTVAEVTELMEKAEEQKDKYIPDQRRYLEKQEAYRQHEERLMERVKSSMDWFGQEDNPNYQEYLSIINHKSLKPILESADPELAPALRFLTAHAVDNLARQQGETPDVQQQAPAPPQEKSRKRESNKPKPNDQPPTGNLSANDIMDDPAPRSTTRGQAGSTETENRAELSSALKDLTADPGNPSSFYKLYHAARK